MGAIAKSLSIDMASIPEQLAMGGAMHSALEPHGSLFVKQTRRGCWQELMSCDAKTEFLISTMESKDEDVIYALEDSSFWNRCFCSLNRAFDINLTNGNSAEGPLVANYKRDLRCPVSPCKCCCRQEVQVKDGAGGERGRVAEQFWYFVPKFEIVDEHGEVEYILSQPTCCGGAIVNLCAEGVLNLRQPFYIFAPDSSTSSAEDKVGKIVKVWTGLVSEVFTGADNFEMHFPDSADPAGKARLMGALFLLNQVFFEGHPQENDDTGYSAIDE